MLMSLGLKTAMLTYSYIGDGTAYGANQIQQKTYANGHTETYSYLSDKTEVSYRNSVDGSVTDKYIYNQDEKGNVTGQEHKKDVGVGIKYDYGDLSNREQQIFTILHMPYYFIVAY